MSEAVAVITRTKNRPHLLRRALQSVRAQSFGAWRQYVVNDGGDAEAARLAIGADPRVEFVDLGTSVGMEAATNRALERVRARWVVLLDDDDSWEPSFLAEAVQALERRGTREIGGVVARSVVVEERMAGESPVEVHRTPFNDDLSALSLEQLACRNQFTNNAFLFERDALELVGPFCEALPVYGDWDFNLRFLQLFDIAVIPSRLACYHRRACGAGTQQNSFAQDPSVAERARAHLTNLWLRGVGGRNPQVGLLIALGGTLSRQEAILGRMDKYFNAFHRLRRLPVLRGLDRLLGVRGKSMR